MEQWRKTLYKANALWVDADFYLCKTLMTLLTDKGFTIEEKTRFNVSFSTQGSPIVTYRGEDEEEDIYLTTIEVLAEMSKEDIMKIIKGY